jgi:hypothetical protein
MDRPDADHTSTSDGAIRPCAAGDERALPSGIPLRRGLHRRFDLRYATVRPDLRFDAAGFAQV